MQFRLREQGVLKLAQQLATGPPDTLLNHWQQPPTLLFLNKQDKLPDNTRTIAVQQIRQQLCSITSFDQVFEGAAMLGQGVDQLKRYLVSEVCWPTYLRMHRFASHTHVVHHFLQNSLLSSLAAIRQAGQSRCLYCVQLLSL